MIAYPPRTSPPPDPPAGGTIHVTRHDVGRRTVLCVAGEIDMATAPAAQPRLPPVSPVTRSRTARAAPGT